MEVLVCASPNTTLGENSYLIEKLNKQNPTFSSCKPIDLLISDVWNWGLSFAPFILLPLGFLLTSFLFFYWTDEEFFFPLFLFN